MYLLVYRGILSQFRCEFAFNDFSPVSPVSVCILRLFSGASQVAGFPYSLATYSIFGQSEFMKKPKARHSHQQMCITASYCLRQSKQIYISSSLGYKCKI